MTVGKPVPLLTILILTYIRNPLVNIHFIYHMLKARDLRETRIYTINTTLKKNQLSINQHHIYITIQ